MVVAARLGQGGEGWDEDISEYAVYVSTRMCVQYCGVCRWMQQWHGMAECRMQNAGCRARRDVPGCSSRRRGQGQGRDRKKEGLPSPASTSIAVPGRRSRSQRQMRIWKYAMLQTRVDGEAVQQPSWKEVGRLGLGVG